MSKVIRYIICYIMCDLFNQHWYESTTLERWKRTGENWICKRCGKAVKSVQELQGTKGKISLSRK